MTEQNLVHYFIINYFSLPHPPQESISRPPERSFFVREKFDFFFAWTIYYYYYYCVGRYIHVGTPSVVVTYNANQYEHLCRIFWIYGESPLVIEVAVADLTVTHVIFGK